MERTRLGPVPAAAQEPDEQVTIVPVERQTRRGRRPIGAYIAADGHVRFQPAVDVERLVLGVVIAAGLAAVAGSAVQRRAAVGSVSMGPGGWLSVRGGVPALRARTSRARTLRARTPGAQHRRPWWARLLRAHRLVVEP